MFIKIIKYLLLITLPGQYCFAQECNDSIFNRFKSDLEAELQDHGKVIWDDDTKESYYSLMINCPVEAIVKYLVKYTDDPSPKVRAYVFVGLAQKGADDATLREILNRHANDTAEFTSGLPSWSVSGFMQFAMQLKTEGKLEHPDYQARLENIRSKQLIIIPGMRHNTISKDALLKVDSLVYSDRTFNIVSFSLSTTNAKMTSGSNFFTPQMKEFIRKMPEGEKVFLEEFQAELPDKSIRRLGVQVWFKVK